MKTIGFTDQRGFALTVSLVFCLVGAWAQADSYGWPKRTADIDQDARFEQWQDYWEPGKVWSYDVSYSLGGKFVTKTELETSIPWAMRWLMQGSLKDWAADVYRLHLGVSGTQRVAILTLANNIDTGFWQSLAYSNEGTFRLSAQYDQDSKRVQKNAENLRIALKQAESDSSWWKRGLFLTNAAEQEAAMQETERLEKRLLARERNREKFFADRSKFVGGVGEYAIDLEDLLEKFKNNGAYDSYKDIKEATAEFVDEFDGRTMIAQVAVAQSAKVVQYPVRLMEGLSLYYAANGQGPELLERNYRKRIQDVENREKSFSGRSKKNIEEWRRRVEKRRDGYWGRMPTIDSVWQKAKACNPDDPLVECYIMLLERNDVWVPELTKKERKQLQTAPIRENYRSDLAFLELSRQNNPNANALFWGVETLPDGNQLEFAPGCQGRELGKTWVVKGAVFNQLRHPDFAEYAFSPNSQVVVMREHDDYDPVTKRPCYVLSIQDSSNEIHTWEYDPVTKRAREAEGLKYAKTTLTFEPSDEEMKKKYASFIWDASRVASEDSGNPLNRIYIDKETGLLACYNIPLVSDIGNQTGKKIGAAAPYFTVEPGTTVYLNFQAQLSESPAALRGGEAKQFDLPPFYDPRRSEWGVVQ